MFADFPPANLEESRAAWAAKEPSAILLGCAEVNVRFFRWPRNEKFTVLEDFALRVIEGGLGNSDEEIARILCLTESEVAEIFESPGLKGKTQGDSSCRELPKGFSREIPDGIAVVEDKSAPSAGFSIQDGEWAAVDALEKSDGTTTGRGDLSDEQRKWMKKTGAHIFALTVSAYRYDKKSWLFLCGGKIVPSALSGLLRKCCGKIGPKSAPPQAVCHRDEFWPWLAHRIRDVPPKSVVFESARRDGRTMGEAEQMKWMEWIRKETSNIDAANVSRKEAAAREAVCLDGERFELRGDFICRAKTA